MRRNGKIRLTPKAVWNHILSIYPHSYKFVGNKITLNQPSFPITQQKWKAHEAQVEWLDSVQLSNADAKCWRFTSLEGPFLLFKISCLKHKNKIETYHSQTTMMHARYFAPPFPFYWVRVGMGGRVQDNIKQPLLPLFQSFNWDEKCKYTIAEWV